MAGKGKFIYIKGEKHDRIFVKDSSFEFNSDTDYAFPLGKFSTDDLLKVKAQIATELENRMDLDEVTESNLEKLKAQIRNAKAEAVAQLVRQTLDRLDVVGADEKRAKTRLEILQDELKYRMVTDEMSEMKFAGLLSVTYKPETVFAVGEDGWTPVYSNIVADSVAGQLADGYVRKQIAESLNVSSIEETVMSDVDDLFEQASRKLESERLVHGTDTSATEQVLDDLWQDVKAIKFDVDRDQIVREITNGLVESVREGLLNPEAFAILQKRLTSTTLNDLLKQGYDLPKGIEQTTIRKVKTKRLK